MSLYNWGEPERVPYARVSLDRHFTSINYKKWNSNPLSSCVTQKFSVVSQIYHNYMIIGLSVSRKAYNKVFLNCHIWSLDCQCHGKHVTKFSWITICGRWIISVTENMWQSFPESPYMVVASSVLWNVASFPELSCVIVWVSISQKYCFNSKLVRHS